MRISEAARLTGLADSNIRFYEKKGLLTPARKAESGYRDYSEEDVRRMKLILLYRKMDFSIENIEMLLKGNISVKDAFRKQEEELAARMEMLQGALDLCRMLDCEESMDDIDVDEYLNYVRDEEKKGRQFGSVELWLDDMAQYTWLTFAKNNPIYGMLAIHPRLGRAFSLLLPLLLFLIPVISLVENHVKGEQAAPGFVIFWGIILLIYILGFIRFRATRYKEPLEKELHKNT